MINLWIVTFVWAFSFSLIGRYISGQIDSYLAIFIRFFLAALCLLPFADYKREWKLKIKIGLTGIVQVGLMYLCFYQSFQFLQVSEVVLFTITTPLYISLIGDLLQRRFNYRHILAALIAIAGSYVIRYQEVSNNFITGLMLVQGANLFFAIGQVYYRSLREEMVFARIADKDVFFYFYLGASLFMIPICLIFSDFEKLPHTQEHYFALLWLGIVASGLCYFLWNTGAKKVGVATLAVMNNMVIPLGILVSVFFFENKLLGTSFFIGSAFLVLSLFVAKNEKN